jgi:hypothetical protein
VVAAGLARTHVHDYADHAHPEHQHGPAAHSHVHHDVGRLPAPAERSMGACDAGDHEVVVRAASIATKPFGGALVAGLAQTDPLAAVRQSVPVRRADVRVHGPPPDTPSAPRAPPLVLPA